MAIIHSVEIKNFRNIKHINTTFSPHTNWIIGNNGSGKTSLIESLCFLSIAKSFKNTPIDKLIQSNNSQFFIQHNFKNDQHLHQISKFYTDNHTINIKLNEQIATRKELAKQTPIRIISPETINQIGYQPQARRHFIDWGLFYIKRDYLNVWLKNKRVVQQINHLIKQPNSTIHNQKEIQGWLNLQAKYSIQINQFRENYIKELLEINKNLCMLPEKVTLKFYLGYPENIQTEKELAHFLFEKIIIKQAKQNLYGAHRSSFTLLKNNIDYEKYFSRGERKKLIINLYLLQINHLKKQINKKTILMIDDLFSEIDQNVVELVYNQLQQQHQVFITTINNQFDLPLGQQNLQKFNICEGNLI